MKFQNPPRYETVCEGLFLLFIFSLFPTLGADSPQPVFARMVFGGGLFVFSLPFLWPQRRFVSLKSTTALFFLAFFGWEILRAVWAFWKLYLESVPEGIVLPLRRYLTSPVKWGFYFFSFLSAFWIFRPRRQIVRLLWVLSASGFFLALNAIPYVLVVLKQRGEYFTGPARFFLPPFYSHPWLRDYVFAGTSHVNYIGDLIGLGFFPALALFFYALWKSRRNILSVVLPILMASTTALAVILLFARGSILSFLIALAVFLAAVLWRYPSRKRVLFILIGLGCVGGLLLWAGNLPEVGKEIATVQGEWDPSASSRSLDTNREGMRRALAIFRQNPLGGVGTDGYRAVAKHFALPGTEGSLADIVVLCHYLQLMAEEGAGTILYFIFLVAYFVEVPRGLAHAESRLQFLAGLALFSAVFMVLLHAWVNQLMQRFAVSLLTYTLMGASLAISSKDFNRA